MKREDVATFVLLVLALIFSVAACMKVSAIRKQIGRVQRNLRTLAQQEGIPATGPVVLNISLQESTPEVPTTNIVIPQMYKPLKDYTDEVVVEEAGGFVTIGNKYLAREFAFSNGQLRTNRVINRRTDGQETVFTPQAESCEFQVKLFDPRENGSEIVPELDRSNWSIEADSYAIDGSNGRPECIIDGNDSTYWHTNYGSGGEGPQEYPHYILIDTKKQSTFVCFSYTPREDSENGNIADFEFYASNSKEDIDEHLILKGTFEYENGNEIMYFNLPQEITARYVKLRGLNAKNGMRFAGGAEFRLHTEKGPEFTAQVFSSQNFLFDKEVTDLENKSGKKIVFESRQTYKFNNIDWKVRVIYSMKNGDHFMRKHIELGCADSQMAAARIDYIDVEHFGVTGSEAMWTHPDDSGVGGMVDFLAGAGQPIFLEGMFFGSEFPVAVNIVIPKKQLAHVREFSGKSFAELQKEKRVNNGYFKSWPAVAGAARSTDTQVVTNDFHSYLRTIETKCEMRAQYNSWYDWMLDIDENNIIKSFYEMERGLTQAGCSSLHAYVVDDGWNAYGPWLGENTAGFWQFNSKFPNGLTGPKTLVERLGSTFGLWLGPRGGYGYEAKFAQFIEENGNGEYNPKSDDICTNHKIYQQKLLEFFIDCQRKYNITYWKLDGFAHNPCPRKHEYHITGGKYGVHWMTEHWERYCGMFVKMREDAKEHGIDDLWLNLTTFVIPSPWFLQYGNSIWLQNSMDIGRVNLGLERQVDQCLTYRDGRVYDFARIHQHKVPQCNVYNHDPIYGKTGSDLAGTMDDDEFRTYVFMIMTRGAALVNLYFSYNMADEGQKWLVIADCLEWRKRNFHILKNSIQFGPGDPAQGFVYGYSCWDGAEGIISIRNPKPEIQSYTITLDRVIGVQEGAANLQRTNVLNFRSKQAYDNVKKYNYGDEFSVDLEPGEAVIWSFSPTEDTVKPDIEFIKNTSTTVSVTFTKRIDIASAQFTVNGAKPSAVTLLADFRTAELTVAALSANQQCTLNATVKDDNGRNSTQITKQFIAYSEHVICKADSANELATSVPESQDAVFNCTVFDISKDVQLKSTQSFQGTHDFNLSFVLNTTSAGTVASQGSDIKVSVNGEGKIVLSVGEYQITSQQSIGDGKSHFISVNRERNAEIKIYIDGQLNESVASQKVQASVIKPGRLVIGGDNFKGKIGAVELLNRALNFNENSQLYDSKKKEKYSGRHYSYDPDDNPLFHM